MKELERLKSISLNNKTFFKNFIVSCNIRSLNAHFLDLLSSSSIKGAEVICLQETWLNSSIENCSDLEINGYQAHFNSVGNGKGVATYFREDYALIQDIKKPNYQMTMVASKVLNIINIYRSSSNDLPVCFLEDLMNIFDDQKKTLLVGDLNICNNSENNHEILRKLEFWGFKQKVTNPTHAEGRQIDHVFSFSPSGETEASVRVHQTGQYFTDHDLMVIDISEYGNNEQVVKKFNYILILIWIIFRLMTKTQLHFKLEKIGLINNFNKSSGKLSIFYHFQFLIIRLLQQTTSLIGLLDFII